MLPRRLPVASGVETPFGNVRGTERCFFAAIDTTRPFLLDHAPLPIFPASLSVPSSIPRSLIYFRLRKYHTSNPIIYSCTSQHAVSEPRSLPSAVRGSAYLSRFFHQTHSGVFVCTCKFSFHCDWRRCELLVSDV